MINGNSAQKRRSSQRSGQCVCVCVCVCTCVCVCVLKESDTQACLHVYMNMYVCIYVCIYVCMHLFSVTNSLDVTRRHGPPTIRHSRKNPATTPSVIRKGASKTDVFFWMYIVNTNHQTSRQNPVTTPPVTRKGALKNEYRVAKTHRTP